VTSARRGRLITLEGIDGAGKSTHIARIRAWIERSGQTVVVTREPGGTLLGERLRELLLSQPMSAEAEVLLMFAARREHLSALIWPALARGDWVLCDRFTDATYAYQGGGREMGFGPIDVLVDWVHPGFAPDLTLLFDLPVALARARIAPQRPLDRFEREKEAFHERVRAAYHRRVAVEPGRFRVIDAARPPELVGAEIEAVLTSLAAADGGSADASAGGTKERTTRAQ
jgi:dTMP kinase